MKFFGLVCERDVILPNILAFAPVSGWSIMVVGICKISLSIHGATSLKMKRKVVKSLKDKVKARFNISIAEIDHHDIHQSALLGVCVVSADQPHADGQLQTVFNFISQNAIVDNVSMEFMSL